MRSGANNISSQRHLAIGINIDLGNLSAFLTNFAVTRRKLDSPDQTVLKFLASGSRRRIPSNLKTRPALSCAMVFEDRRVELTLEEIKAATLVTTVS